MCCYNIRKMAAIPNPHEVAWLLPRQVVCAECHHPPEIILLLTSAQPTDSKARNIPFCHFCKKHRNRNREKMYPLEYAHFTKLVSASAQIMYFSIALFHCISKIRC